MLGLSLDDPENAPQTFQTAPALLASLIAEFDAKSGLAGVELPPPQSEPEWTNDALVLLLEGTI